MKSRIYNGFLNFRVKKVNFLFTRGKLEDSKMEGIYKKRGLDENPAPFLNPISYEKPLNRPLIGMKRCIKKEDFF